MDDTIVQQVTEKRKLCALRIVEAGHVSPNGSPHHYDVHSQSGNGCYLAATCAAFPPHGRCDCPDFEKNGTLFPCQHVQAVEIYETAERYVERQARRLGSYTRVVTLAQAKLEYGREMLSDASRLTLSIIAQTAQRLDDELWQAAEEMADRRRAAYHEGLDMIDHGYC